MTPAMWEVLLGAKRFGWICQPWMRSANILVRRGFIDIECKPYGFHDVQKPEVRRLLGERSSLLSPGGNSVAEVGGDEGPEKGRSRVSTKKKGYRFVRVGVERKTSARKKRRVAATQAARRRQRRPGG